MKHRSGISLYVHKLPEASNRAGGGGARVSNHGKCRKRETDKKKRKEKKRNKNSYSGCDITPIMPHWFKLPIVLSSRASRFERIRRLRESNLCSSKGGRVQARWTSEMVLVRKKMRERFIIIIIIIIIKFTPPSFSPQTATATNKPTKKNKIKNTNRGVGRERERFWKDE